MGVDYNFDSFYAHITFSRYKGMTKTFLLQYLVIESPPIKCGAGTKWFILGGGGGGNAEKCLYSEFSRSVFPHIRTEYGKTRTRKTPNTNIFHAVKRKNVILPRKTFPDGFFE